MFDVVKGFQKALYKSSALLSGSWWTCQLCGLWQLCWLIYGSYSTPRCHRCLHRWYRSTLFNLVFVWKLSRNCGARSSPPGCFSEPLNPAASVHGDCGNQSLPTANRYIQDCSGDVPSWIVVSAHSAVRLGVETRMGPVNIFWFSFQVHRHIEKHLYCERRLKDG